MNKYYFLLLITLFISCEPGQQLSNTDEDLIDVAYRANEFVEFTLTTDVSVLSENQKKMIPILIEVAEIMDGIFWQEAYGDKKKFVKSLKSDR